MKETNTKKAIDFFVFSCVGLKPNTNVFNEITKCAVLRAYRDAASHVLSVKDEYKEKKKQEGTELIANFISSLDNKTISDYDKAHSDLCDEIMKTYAVNGTEWCAGSGIYKNDRYKMTIGIAQKWINMSVKYFYLISLVYNKTSLFSGFHDYIKDFHIPLDSIMLEKIEEKLNINKKDYGIVSWSKVDNYKDYLKYQNAVKNQIPNHYQSALDWECDTWLE